MQKLVGTNLNRPQIFRRAWAGGQVSSFNAYIDKQESTLKGVLKEGSNMQSNPVQNENTNIQYPVWFSNTTEVSVQYSIWRIQNKTKNKEQVSVLILERV